MSISIVLADDHYVVRVGVRALLEDDADFHVVGEASNGLEAVEVVRTLRPDVLILDLMMPGLNGLEVARLVRQHSPMTRIVILSMYGSEGYVLEAFRRGVLGYVLKDGTGNELPLAVREAARGKRYLSPSLNERALDAYAQRAKEVAPDPYESLTTRERQILQAAAEGYTNAEIAERFTISRRTAEYHRANLMQKLGLHNQAELIRYAMKRGLLTLND